MTDVYSKFFFHIFILPFLPKKHFSTDLSTLSTPLYGKSDTNSLFIIFRKQEQPFCEIVTKF